VVASLWSVPDRSTADLMGRFHESLHSGSSSAEALRRAQLCLIRGASDDETGDAPAPAPNTSHPYFWAGFELYGDWR
jgi:CHAT domain-containing protein